MNQLHTIMMVLTIVASAGTIVKFSIESVDAWHSQFDTKNDCISFIMDVFGNTTKEAKSLCQKAIPH